MPIDAPAIIVCTSGSTGEPKAIVHSQRTMMGKVWAQMNGVGARPGDICLSLSSAAAMAGAAAVLACAVAGVGLRVLDLRREGIAGLIDTLTHRPVTLLRAAPSALRLLTAVPDASRILQGIRGVSLFWGAGPAHRRACVARLPAAVGGDPGLLWLDGIRKPWLVCLGPTMRRTRCVALRDG